MGNDPNEAYEGESKALQFELREEAINKMAQQNAVVVQNQKTYKKMVHSRLRLARNT